MKQALSGSLFQASAIYLHNNVSCRKKLGCDLNAGRVILSVDELFKG